MACYGMFRIPHLLRERKILNNHLTDLIIVNVISDPNTVKLTSKGDLSYFYKYLDEKAGKKGKPAQRKKPAARPAFASSQSSDKQNTKCVAGDKTVKQVHNFIS